MKIVNKKIADIVPYEHNPRHNDEAVNFVANSIREFGFKVPIVLDANNVIVAGHTRIKAAELLDMKEVPCIVADDLTDEQIRAFRLADNRTAELAEWIYDELGEELNRLEMDMAQFGFEAESQIDWSKVEEITEHNYEEPASAKLRCPMCGGVDEKIRFVTVNEDIS